MDNNFSDHFDHRNAVKVLKTHSSGMASGFNAIYLRSFSSEVTAVSWKITNYVIIIISSMVCALISHSSFFNQSV